MMGQIFMDRMFKIISLFIFCNLAFARTQVPHSFITKVVPPNIRCFSQNPLPNSVEYCTQFSISQTSLTYTEYTSSSYTIGNAFVFPYKTDWYCPNLSTNTTYITGEDLRHSAAYVRLTSPAGVTAIGYVDGFGKYPLRMYRINSNRLFIMNSGGATLYRSDVCNLKSAQYY